MPSDDLFIWVEGNDDERFFKTVISPMFHQKYKSINFLKYAEWTRKKICNYLRSIKGMNAHYLFVVDINRAPCVTQKKQEIQREYKNIDEDRIVVVIKVIESWYVAGLHHASCKKLGVRYFRDPTETVAKDRFNRLMPKKLGPRTNFMIEILNRFSVETAKKRNGSFRYFIEKHDC